MSRARTRGTAFVAALALMAGFGVSACEEEGPAEQAGESVDESAEEVGEALEETGDEVEDTIN
jgi:hypothetical protein